MKIEDWVEFYDQFRERHGLVSAEWDAMEAHFIDFGQEIVLRLNAGEPAKPRCPSAPEEQELRNIHANRIEALDLRRGPKAPKESK